jgi:hypothetical protein
LATSICGAPSTSSFARYHEQRPHQGLDNKLITAISDQPSDGNKVVVDKRLGGMLRSNRRSA